MTTRTAVARPRSGRRVRPAVHPSGAGGAAMIDNPRTTIYAILAMALGVWLHLVLSVMEGESIERRISNIEKSVDRIARCNSTKAC
jgi:hypothetical protein